MRIHNRFFSMYKPADGEISDAGGDTGVQGTGNDARLALLDAINDQNDVVRADELQSVNDDGTTEAFVVRAPDGGTTPLTDEIKPDAEAQATIDALAAEAQPEAAPQMITRKINGHDVTRSLDDWLTSASKIEAADQYLAEASRLRQEQASGSVKTDPTPVANDDLAIARAIQMGTEEEAVAALRTLRQPASPSVTTADIARTIDERLTFNEAISQYRKDYADIVGDPVLNQLAQETDRKLIAQGDKRPYTERYADIGNTLREWADKLAKERAPAISDKLARKAAATPVPKAASQKTMSTVEDEVEETTSSIIAGIAQSRGGPQWMNGPVTRQ